MRQKKQRLSRRGLRIALITPTVVRYDVVALITQTAARHDGVIGRLPSCARIAAGDLLHVRPRAGIGLLRGGMHIIK